MCVCVTVIRTYGEEIDIIFELLRGYERSSNVSTDDDSIILAAQWIHQAFQMCGYVYGKLSYCKHITNQFQPLSFVTKKETERYRERDIA